MRLSPEFNSRVKVNDDLKRLASLDIFVYSIRLNAFHLIVLESLSRDTPVVAYDIPCH
jgi:glycosyltransferase involved in cell wall biosynthesis